MNTVIGLDIGHSMVKAVAISSEGRHVAMFPSVVAAAIPLSDEAAARDAERETVNIEGRQLFVGQTAVNQGAATSVTGLSQDWIASAEHTALFVTAMKKLSDAGASGVKDAVVVMGLPSEYYKSQRDLLKEFLNGKGGSEIVVQPQPAGPYHGLMFNQDGTVAAGRSVTRESWAVVDIGHFTTDFLLMMEGKRIELGLGSAKGVAIAVDYLRRLVRDKKGIEIDLLEAEEALRTGKIRNFGKLEDVSAEVQTAIGVVVGVVIDKAEALITPFARKLDGVILAGGGAHFLFRDIKARWPHTVMASEPRLAIADGFARYGRSLQRARALTKAA